MKTKEVLELSCMFLGKEDLLSSGYFIDGAQQTTEHEKDIDILLRCLNLITNEISTDCLPITCKKEIVFSQKLINIKDIDENIYEIVKIQDMYGKNLKFKIYENFVSADVAEATITYNKFAAKCLLNGDVEDFGGKMPARVLAYGVAMEYSLVSSLFDDASVWENRYKNSLLMVAQKKNNILLPKRRWF